MGIPKEMVTIPGLRQVFIPNSFAVSIMKKVEKSRETKKKEFFNISSSQNIDQKKSYFASKFSNLFFCILSICKCMFCFQGFNHYIVDFILTRTRMELFLSVRKRFTRDKVILLTGMEFM
jgi:hypothetical protein